MLILKIIRELLILICIVIAIAVVYRFVEHKKEIPPLGTQEKRDGPGWNPSVAIREIFPIGEYNSMRIDGICSIDTYGTVVVGRFRIPGTEKSLRYNIPVTLKLGVDCEKIDIDAAREDSVFITFPPIKILSTEQHLKDAYIKEKDGILNKVTLQEQHDMVIEKIKQFQDSIMGRVDIVMNAKRSTEFGFKSLLDKHPNRLPPSFRWRDDNTSVMIVETKGELGKTDGQ